MKKIIIILSSILAVGILCLLTSGIIYSQNHDVLDEMSGGPYEIRKLNDIETITSLNIISNSGKIELYDSIDGTLQVEYPENKFSTYTYTNKNGVATLKETNKAWVLSFNLFMNKPTTKIYIPNNYEGDFSYTQHSGETTSNLTSLNANNIKLHNSSGKINLTNLTAVNKLELESSSGTINVSKIKSNKIEVESSSGVTTLIDIDCTEFETDLSSGSATFTNLKANKISSKCSSGSITFKLDGNKDDYSYNLKASSGYIKLGENTIKRDPYETTDKEKSFYGRVSSGSMIIQFQ